MPTETQFDWHATIRNSLGDASVLLDRAEHDPASMHGVVSRLLNALTFAVDENRALAKRVDWLTARLKALGARLAALEDK